MKYFTPEQIDEIRKALATLGVKDTDLPDAGTITGSEKVAIVQKGENRVTTIAELIDEGTIAEIVKTIQQGKSAYDIAVDNGYVGSEQDWLNSLHGAKGDKGDKGDSTAAVIPPASDTTLGGIKTGYPQTGNNYPVSTDALNRAFVNVPDPTVNVPDASPSQVGGIKLGYQQNGKNYPLQVDGDKKAFVNVPWYPGEGGGGEGYVLPHATTGSLGGIKLGYNQRGKNYPIQLDADDKAFVNVPWEGGGGGGGGEDGGYWDSAYCGTLTETAPSRPESDDPIDGSVAPYYWSHTAPTNATGGYIIWQCIRWVEGNGTSNGWQGPWRLSGSDGEAGVDGDNYEYIYTRTESESSPTPSLTNTTPEPGQGSGDSPSDPDFVPQGWTDNPQGIEDVAGHRVEWMAFRRRVPVYEDGEIVRDEYGNVVYEFTAFVGPIVWAVYGKSGMDGDGIEYIFYKGTTYPTAGARPDGWSTTDPDFQNREYIPDGQQYPSNPNGWKDDPFDLENETPGTKQWVSIRKKYADNPGENPLWHSYSEPVLWNYAPKDGDAGIGVIADLDNETMAVSLDANGDNYAYNQVAEAVMYNGASVIASAVHSLTVVTTAGVDVTSTYVNTSDYTDSTKMIYVTTSGSKNYIHVVFAAQAVNLLTSGLDVHITLRAPSVGTDTDVDRPVTLHIIGVKFGTDGDDGACYILNLGAPVIRVNRSNGTRTPASIIPTCDWTLGSVPQTPFTPSAPETGFTFKYSIDDGTENLLTTNSIATNAITDNLRVVLLYNNALVDQETIPVIIDGTDGKNAIHLDLDNESDIILYNESGTRISGQVTTTARLYDGDTNITSSATLTISQRSGCTSGQATIDNSGVVTVTNINTSGFVMIRALYNGVYYYAKFTLKKQIGGVKYQICTTPSAIGYNVTDQSATDDQLVITTRMGWQDADGYHFDTISTFPLNPSASIDGSYELYLTVNGTKISAGEGSASGNPATYTVDPIDYALSEYTIEIVRKTAHEQTRPIGPSVITYTYETLDSETVPICKTANGQPGATGQNALPLRIRNWSDVYRGNQGDVPLAGDMMLFSGFETGAKFRDVVLVTPADYVGGAGYPFMESDEGMPTFLVINYNETNPNGYDGTQIDLPYQSGGVGVNYTEQIAPDKNTSEALFDDGYLWSVFMNFGALYTSMLIATSAYIDDLTVRKLNTGGDASSTRRIVAESNILSMYDDNNDEKLRISGDNLSTSHSNSSFTPSSGTVLSNATVSPAPIEVRAVGTEGTSSTTSFTVNSGAVISIPQTTVNLSASLFNYNDPTPGGGNNVKIGGNVRWVVDGEKKGTATTINATCGAIYSGTVTIPATSIPVESGSHTLALYVSINASSKQAGATADSVTFNASFTPQSCTVVYSTQLVEIGANGFQAVFGANQVFSCSKNGSAVNMNMQVGDYGLRVDATTVGIRLGGSWYDISVVTGTLKATLSQNQ